MSFLSAMFDRRGWNTMVSETLGRGSPRLPTLRKEGAAPLDQAWLETFLRNFIALDPANRFEQQYSGEPIYQAPLIGFVKGDDPLLEKYQELIGPFHHTPVEVLAWAAKEQGVKAPAANEIGVVSFVLPLSDATVKATAAENSHSSVRWAQTRLFGEICMRKMMQQMIAELGLKGILAAAGDFMPDFRKRHFPKIGWGSPWSHRHIAFAAGLGGFGMHDALITEKGCAHRCGSVVVAMPVKPNRERLAHYRYNCKQHRLGNCMTCAKRCPIGAITEKGHDKEACSKYVMKSIPRNIFRNKVAIYSCGLCMAGTPCAQKIPMEDAK